MAPETGFAGGQERVLAADDTEVGITLVELTEAADPTNFLDLQIAAWRANSDLISSQQIEVPGMPEARGLRFESGLDWVRLFALHDVYAVDVSVRNSSDDVDALDVATQVLSAQLDHLAGQLAG